MYTFEMMGWWDGRRGDGWVELEFEVENIIEILYLRLSGFRI